MYGEGEPAPVRQETCRRDSKLSLPTVRGARSPETCSNGVSRLRAEMLTEEARGRRPRLIREPPSRLPKLASGLAEPREGAPRAKIASYTVAPPAVLKVPTNAPSPIDVTASSNRLQHSRGEARDEAQLPTIREACFQSHPEYSGVTQLPRRKSRREQGSAERLPHLKPMAGGSDASLERRPAAPKRNSENARTAKQNLVPTNADEAVGADLAATTGSAVLVPKPPRAAAKAQSRKSGFTGTTTFRERRYVIPMIQE